MSGGLKCNLSDHVRVSACAPDSKPPTPTFHINFNNQPWRPLDHEGNTDGEMYAYVRVEGGSLDSQSLISLLEPCLSLDMFLLSPVSR